MTEPSVPATPVEVKLTTHIPGMPSSPTMSTGAMRPSAAVVWLALIASLPATIAAIATLVVGMSTNTGVAKVHELTNSRLTEVTSKLDARDATIEEMQKMIFELQTQIKGK